MERAMPSGGKVSHTMNEKDRISGRDLSAHVMGEGTPEERREVEEALAGSEELRREHESLRRTWILLDGYEAPEAPAGGLEDLHRRIGGRAVPLRTAPGRRIPRRSGVAAAAAAILFAVGLSILFLGGSGEEPGDIVNFRPPEVASTDTGDGTRASLASLSPENGVRRFLPGEDGNLYAGATIQVGSLAEWADPVLHVQHMDDLSDLKIEDYTVTNYEFEGAGVSTSQPDIVRVSMDPM
jgi:hypothetical protein